MSFEGYLEINYTENLDGIEKILIKDAYKAGAQSRQAEIDELRSLCESIIKDDLEKTDRLESIINQNNKEIEELQKRIDRLLLISGCDLDENDFES